MAQDISNIEEKKIREDQEYRDKVKQLQNDVAKILEMLTGITESNKKRTRFVITTCITVFLVMFAGVFAYVSGNSKNIATHDSLQKFKAEREAVNYAADWLKALDIKTGLGYSGIYYDMVKRPPEETRGGKSKQNNNE